MSDPLLLPESHQYVALEILTVLDEFRYPTLISTKASLLNNRKILATIAGKPYFAVQVSFSTLSDRIASFLEPYAPRPSSRLEGAKRLLEDGTWVSFRLQPYIPNDDVETIVDTIAHHKFTHITIEHLKLPIDKRIDPNIWKIFRLDIRDIFPKGSRIRRGREWEMPLDIRKENIIRFLNAGRRNCISIGIGDNGLQHFSTTDCCCGVDSLPHFENWFKHNSLAAVQRADEEGHINYEEIANEWAPGSSISRMINSNTRLRDVKNTIKNHIKRQWRENGHFSPAMFYGVVAETGSGSIRYRLTQNAILEGL